MEFFLDLLDLHYPIVIVHYKLIFYNLCMGGLDWVPCLDSYQARIKVPASMVLCCYLETLREILLKTFMLMMNSAPGECRTKVPISLLSVRLETSCVSHSVAFPPSNHQWFTSSSSCLIPLLEHLSG